MIGIGGYIWPLSCTRSRFGQNLFQYGTKISGRKSMILTLKLCRWTDSEEIYQIMFLLLNSFTWIHQRILRPILWNEKYHCKSCQTLHVLLKGFTAEKWQITSSWQLCGPSNVNVFERGRRMECSAEVDPSFQACKGFILKVKSFAFCC